MTCDFIAKITRKITRQTTYKNPAVSTLVQMNNKERILVVVYNKSTNWKLCNQDRLQVIIRKLCNQDRL